MSTTKLTSRFEQINVITAHKVLSHANNSCCHAGFTVMVLSSAGYVVCQLGNLDFSVSWTLDGTIQHFSLTRLEAINHRGNTSNVITHTKEHKLSVDEILNLDFVNFVVDECFSLCNYLLIERSLF